MKLETTITPKAINWTLFVVGMLIVWLATHSIVGLLGALVASIHITYRVAKESRDDTTLENRFEIDGTP